MAKKKNVNQKSKNLKASPIPTPDLFERLGNRAPLLLLGLLVIISFIAFKDFLLQDKYYLFKTIGSDSVNGIYPYNYCVAEYLTRHTLPGWSFNMGMGRSLFPFVFQDPFSIILYAVGKDHIMGAMVWKEVAKVILSGMIFFYYLRLLKLSDFTAIIGGLLYAFCSFMIVGSFWSYFSFEALNMALLLLSFELLFTKGKWFLFPLPIFFICISQPVNLYIYGLFLAFYAVLRLFHSDTFSLKNLGAIFLKMMLFGAIGILLSGPFLLENIFQLLTSPRGSGANSYAHELMSTGVFALQTKHQLGTCLLRFFSSDMAGTGQFFEGWYNYLEAPEFYCGLPCLLLMPQVFGFLNKKMKVAFAVFLSIWFIGILFPWFRYAFWLFSGDYFRAYSFFGAFCFLFFSLMALDLIIKRQKINVVALLASLAVLFFVLLYPFFPPKEELLFPDQAGLAQPLFVFAGVALVAYAVVLFFMGRPGKSACLKYFFLVMVIGELSFLTQRSVNNMDEIEASEVNKNFGYNDYQQDAVNYIKRQDSSFFRIDKGCFSAPTRLFSFNDAMVQEYRGTCCYNSFNQLYYIYYLQLMGVADKTSERNSRWALGTLHRPLLESLNSVKYLLKKKFSMPFWNIEYDSIATFGDVKVLRNKYVLPLGVTYNNFIEERIFNDLSNDQKDLVSLKACVVKDDDVNKAGGLKEFNLNDTIATSIFNTEGVYVDDTGATGKFNSTVYDAYISSLKKDTMTLIKGEDNYIKGTVTVDEKKMLYLSVPWDKGWSLYVDAKPTDKIILSAGMTGVMLDKGAHTIEMDFEPPFLRKGLWLSAIGALFYAGLFFYRKKIRIS